MLERKKHEIILQRILKDIFKHKSLQGQLAFKGGTCLYFFHNLGRFSTDLDFNLRVENFDVIKITEILEKYLNIENFFEKRNTIFWVGSYERGKQKIKVEISRRRYPDQYVNSNYFGILIPTLAPEYMFAHKLCAIKDRNKFQNRDLYDAWFMFEKQWEPNEGIIELRMGMSVKEYFKHLIAFIEENVDEKYILGGLGVLLDEKQKDFVRKYLVKELLFHLKIRSK